MKVSIYINGQAVDTAVLGKVVIADEIVDQTVREAVQRVQGAGNH